MKQKVRRFIDIVKYGAIVFAVLPAGVAVADCTTGETV